jgi:hypothetical protein
MTPAEAARPSAVVELAQGDLWLWRDGDASARRIEIGDAVAAWPSPDGQLVALARQSGTWEARTPQSIWILDLDGDGLRELASGALLEADLGDTGMVASVYQVQWIPGSHQLTWRISPAEVDGLGGPMPTIVRIADTDAGIVGEMALEVASEQAMSWSSTGVHAAVVAFNSVRIVGRSGTTVSEAKHDGAHVGMGHGPYLRSPQWDISGKRLGLVVPRAPVKQYPIFANYAFDVLVYDSPELTLATIATITATLPANGPYLSPDLKMVASHVSEPFRDTTMQIEATDGSWRTILPGAEFRAWAPDGQHYVFLQVDEHELRVAGTCMEPVTVSYGAGSEPERMVAWIDDARFVFLERRDIEGNDPWALRLAGIDGTSKVLATMDHGPRLPAICSGSSSDLVDCR